MNTVIKNSLISVGIMLAAIGSDITNAQGFTPKQDVLRVSSNGIAYANLSVKNHNDYKQAYVITRNGAVLKGELRLHPNQSRKVRIKLVKKGINKVCLVSIPKKNQNRVISFCDSILIK